jgi:uncharacterized membrane protein
MEVLGIVFAAAAIGYFLVMPLAAYLRAGGAKEGLETEAQRLREELRLLRDRVAALEGAKTEPRPAVVAPGPAPVTPGVAVMVAAAEPAPIRAPEPVATAAGALEAFPESSAAAPAAESERKDSLEEKIALVWFTRAGALAMLVGVAYFFKYAIDNDWIGPLGRVALGAALGIAVLFAAELARPRTRAMYVHVLSGVGLAMLYLSAYASHAFYGLVAPAPAFAAFFVITLLGGALSVRHRAEAVLILTLLAGCAAPILLSTGEDRPAALFGYLFILGAGGLAVAVAMNFQIAAWVAVGGPSALFTGWYGKYFEVRDGSAYEELSARLVPLAAVAVFTAQWLAAYEVARRRKTLQPTALALAAFLLAHLGLTALLFDKPILLGVLLTATAVAATAIMTREKRTELLALPLAASFAALYGVSRVSHVHSPPWLIGLFGLWAGVYVLAFLREQSRRETKPTAAGAAMAWLACAALAAFGLLSWSLLGEEHLAIFALVLALLSLAYVAVGEVFSLGAIALGAAAASLLAQIAAEPSGSDHQLVLVAALWFAAYLAPGAWELLSRKVAPAPQRLLTISAAGLGFVLLMLRQTGNDEALLRSALLAAVGAVDLFLGVRLLRLERRAASVLLGQALALFAGAIALLLSGASITLVWAAMAAVVAVLAAREKDELWLAGAGALFAAVFIRLVTIDLNLVETQRALWFATSGAKGVLRGTVLFNARAFAFLGSGAALFVSARAAARAGTKRFSQAALAFVPLGHLLFLFVAVTEAMNLALHTPPAPPSTLGAQDLSLFLTLLNGAIASQEQTLSMVATLTLALYAALLVVLGFTLRDKLHRYLGLGLFAATLGKLLLWDVWHLSRLYQTLVLLALGALLLGASFLYARFGKRLVSLIRDGAAVLLLLFAGRAHALETARFLQQSKSVRPVQGVAAPGLYRLELDPALYRQGLASVRLAGPDGAEVPYLVRDVPIPQPAVHHAATMVDPVTLPGGAARAVFDLGRAGLKHSEVRLSIEGNDFLRRARIEVATDERHFARLLDDAHVYAVGETRHTAVAYPVSDARYLRVTILAGAGGQLRITGGEVSYAVSGSKPVLRRLPATLSSPASDAGPHAQVHEADLGEPGVPVERLGFDISTPAFERRASLEMSDRPPYWITIGSGLLYRAGDQEELYLNAGRSTRRWFRVRIQSGDNAPLALTAAWAEYRAQELIFRAGAAGPHLLYAGSKLDAPAYDLAAVIARGGEGPIAGATLGSFAANASYGSATPEGPQPFSERHRTALTAILALAVFSLAIWTIRLLRNPT